jgi:hypothetical protein
VKNPRTHTYLFWRNEKIHFPQKSTTVKKPKKPPHPAQQQHLSIISLSCVFRIIASNSFSPGGNKKENILGAGE